MRKNHEFKSNLKLIKGIPSPIGDYCLEKSFRPIIEGLGNLEEAEPPAIMAENIMKAITPKNSLMRRIAKALKKPMTVTFSPSRLIPVAMAMILVTFSVIWLTGPDKTKDGLEMRPVVFTLNQTEAEKVFLVGSFNRWDPKGYEMRAKSGEGLWRLEVKLPEGRHEYAFLIDGKRLRPDPSSKLQQDDGFGHKNSVIYINGGISI